MRIFPIILCGGTGARLWPLSRERNPKQLLSLAGEQSLLQNTAMRCGRLSSGAPPLVVCNEEHRFAVADQLKSLGEHRLLLEPVARGTAAAVALGATEVLANMAQLDGATEGSDPIIVALPSDHIINDEAAFQAALEQAVQLATMDYLVTFGVVPARPETGYGYIRAGDALDDCGARIDAFVEKPSLDVAESFVEDGRHYWNSGMFVFRATRYLSELRAHRPAIHEAVSKAVQDRRDDADFVRVSADAMRDCPSDSIDCAVMENTRHGAVVPLDAGWSDIGSWDSLWQASPKDACGNVIQGDVVAESVRDSYLRAEHRRLSVLGVSGLVVVETPDAVLVVPRAEAERVRQLAGTVDQDAH